jgi:hypothetical protein
MRRLAAITLAAAIAMTAGLAQGETTQVGNLRLKFDGQIKPKNLPRRADAPVTIEVSGQIGTADGQRPPGVRRIAFLFNRYGVVSTVGLPTCEVSELEQTSSRLARERCGDAMVGHGTFVAYVELDGRKPVRFDGEALAFNSQIDGRPALLLHVYGTNPTAVTFVLPFRITKVRRGDFGTSFAARPPKIAGHLGYITNLDLTIGRRYSYRGRQRSYLSARCAVPAGIPGAVFTLAKGNFTFSDGQRISTSISRNCWVR